MIYKGAVVVSKQKPNLNKNGIPINKHLSLSLLQVMGADDPFEGKKFDPQFEAVREVELGNIERGKEK